LQSASLVLLWIVSLVIIYQDLKNRLISWFLLPLLLVALMLTANINRWEDFLINTSLNFSFLIVQYILLKIYFYVKERRTIIIIDKLIGKGDVYFIITLIFGFSIINYILVVIGGLIFSLVVFLIYSSIHKHNQNTVPLAGLLSIFLLMIKTTGYIYDYNWQCDSNLINFIIS